MKLPMVLISVVLFLAPQLGAVDLDLTGEVGAGYSIVDVFASTGWDESDFLDWNEVNIRLNVQGTYGLGSFRAGLELGYSWLYYYDVRVLPGPIYYFGWAEAFNASVLGEFRFDNLAIQAGAGGYFFSDGTSFGIHAAGTWRFRLRNPSMSIPLTLRFDVIFGRAVIVPISILTGFSYSLAD